MNVNGSTIGTLLGILPQDTSPAIGENSEEKGNGKTVYGGTLKLNGQDALAEKKAKAQKEAMKKLMDQHKIEKGLDDKMKGLANNLKDISEQSLDLQKQMDELDDKTAELKETYGVSEGSDEEKDLKLLEKQYRMSNGNALHEKYTDEEKNRLENMGPMTDYQEQAMDVYKSRDSISKQNDELQKQFDEINGTLHQMYKDRLKHDGMVDADKQADAILAAASQEIIQGIINDVKDHVDEKQDENKEKADELKEKEQEKEKAQKKDDSSESNAGVSETQSMVQIVADSALDTDTIMMELKKYVVDENVLPEDATGIEVDKKI